MLKSNFQSELNGGIEQVFNLASECGVDPERLIKERREAEAAAAVAREFERKMQRTVTQCPGFVGADAPSSERSRGHVVVEPAMALEARNWLKRRFYINESLELSDQGLCIEIIPRVRKARGTRQPAFRFAKPEQFQFAL